MLNDHTHYLHAVKTKFNVNRKVKVLSANELKAFCYKILHLSTRTGSLGF